MNKPNFVLFISGIPAVGKSSFGNWLETEKGFIHYDWETAEGQARANADGLAILWNCCLDPRNIAAFLNEAHRRDRPIVWNWGFPVQYLYIYRELKGQKARIWWFKADPHYAEKAFLKRREQGKHTSTIADLKRQMSNITTNLLPITQIFGQNLVTTIRPDGSFMDPAEIYEIIMAKERM